MMNSTAARFVFAAGILGLVTAGWILTGRAASPGQQGFPTDWSHHHLIFSRPANEARTARVEADPRYWQQFARRNVVRVLSEDGYNAIEPSTFRIANPRLAARRIHRDWSENMGSGATSGDENYPAKYTFQTVTANCASSTTPDYVVFNTGLTGSSSQASIIAYDNLYTGCGGTVPQTYWAYNTGGQVLTSPAISLDGTQVAFVQTNGGLLGTLVLLKWKASSGSINSPGAITSVSNANYRTCTAPCMTTITLRGGGTAVDDTTSSVFPDYNNDVIWVGSAFGWLHKINAPFLGTPAEVTTGGFPVQVSSSDQTSLSSPVFDGSSGNVFVGSYGGYLYRVNATTAAVVRTAQLDHGTGIVLGPIVDSSAGKVYLPSSRDASSACTGGAPCAALYILGTGFAPNSSGTEIQIGASTATAPPNPKVAYLADFDSTYENSTNANGNIYICGDTGGAPTLYRIPMVAGTPGPVLAGPVLAGAATGCSNVTDVYNPSVTGGATEWIYASVQGSGLGRNCGSAGCIFSFKNTPWLASHAYTVGQEVLDTHFQVQVVSAATGASGTTTPAWSQTPGKTTTDNLVTWINQGPYSAGIKGWTANTNYNKSDVILDNHGNVEVNTSNGVSTSGGTTPAWNTTIGGPTNEPGGPHWVNAGPVATNDAFAAGGTSGIGFDNTSTFSGASQIYYSILGTQNCTTSGSSGGCAVQASQSTLQ